MSQATPLSNFEKAALIAIAAEYPAHQFVLTEVFKKCSASRRKNTGSGFFTDLECSAVLPAGLHSPLGDARFKLAGIVYPFECLLFHRNGVPTLLEGYTLAGEDTKDIDFLSVDFAPWPATG